MKFSALKVGRIILALLFFLPILFFFCDFADIFPDRVSNLLRVQVVPAILAGSVVILIILALLTLLFGRIYCSVICPMGVFQDIISWFTKRGERKNKKKRWYHYHKAQNILRYSILAICVIFLVLGITAPILLLDPYSNFGRIATNLFRPVVMEGNNLINWIAIKAGNFSFYHVSIFTVTAWSLIIALIAFFTVGIMSLLRGRLFCNTICPVGSLLGLLSRYSMFKVVLNSNCTHCGLCARACKAECIDAKTATVDHSRCVTCYNCLDRCKFNAIGYQYAWKKEKAAIKQNEITKETKMAMEASGQINRRTFITTSTAIAATLPVIPLWAKPSKIDATKLTPITPPGSRNLNHFKKKCTACHLCITHCPQQILKPAGFNFGINYAFKPHMVFYEMAFCNFECNVCSQVCPNGAIEKISVDEKKTTQVGIAKFDIERCVVYTDGTDCGACSEHCPTQAVKMEPYKEGLRLPVVTDILCVGCGGCESICPVRPIKAINVLANEVHQASQKPEEEEIEHFEIDDFGF